MTGDLHAVTLSSQHEVRCDELAEPGGGEVAHVRSAVLLLREEPDIRLREMH